MQKGLLSALSETWGLKPAELHQLRLLGERLFDNLSEGLSAIAGHPVSVEQLKLELESSGDFFAQPKPYHFTSLGFSDERAIILKIDLGLAFIIIRAAVGGDVASLAAAAESPALTPIESRVLARVAPEVFIGAVERVLSGLFANRQGLRVLFSLGGRNRGDRERRRVGTIGRGQRQVHDRRGKREARLRDSASDRNPGPRPACAAPPGEAPGRGRDRQGQKRAAWRTDGTERSARIARDVAGRSSIAGPRQRGSDPEARA